MISLRGWPRPNEWRERLSFLAWFVERLSDVRSDMSRFHRIDEVEAMPAQRFVEFALRLPAYGGVVAVSARKEFSEELTSPTPAVESIAANPSPQDLMALNNTALYGPLPGQEVGLFNVRIIGGEDA